jgi:hypothetical protein
MTLVMLMMACDNGPASQQANMVPSDWSGIAEGVFKPVVISRQDLNLNVLVDDLARDLHEIDFNEHKPGAPYDEEKGYYVGADILLKHDDVTVISIEGENPPISDSDDSACGATEADDWKSYGTAKTASETKTLIDTAVKDLEAKLSHEQNAVIRIQRNTSTARVCGRIVSK